MGKKQQHWFHHWFNDDYLKLYSYRDSKEAERQTDFLIKALNLKNHEKILDLGCGLGRHVIALAKKGFDATGVDLSEFLIQQGSKSLAKHPQYRARLIAGDMFDLNNLGTFSVVLNMFTSFGYFAADSDNAKIFEVAARHLCRSGKFFLDYLHPQKVKHHFNSVTKTLADGENVRITKRIEGDRVIKSIIFSSPKRTYEEKVKLYSRHQIQEMLAQHGLNVVRVWNDYEGNPWREKGDRQLFYCVKH